MVCGCALSNIMVIYVALCGCNVCCLDVLVWLSGYKGEPGVLALSKLSINTLCVKELMMTRQFCGTLVLEQWKCGGSLLLLFGGWITGEVGQGSEVHVHPAGGSVLLEIVYVVMWEVKVLYLSVMWSIPWKQSGVRPAAEGFLSGLPKQKHIVLRGLDWIS